MCLCPEVFSPTLTRLICSPNRLQSKTRARSAQFCRSWTPMLSTSSRNESQWKSSPAGMCGCDFICVCLLTCVGKVLMKLLNPGSVMQFTYCFFQHHTDIFKFTCSVCIICVETLLAPLDSTNILTVIITFFPCICLFVRHRFVSMPCSLKNIVGPLRLTMTDVSADLNNLVRTFRSVQHKHTLLCGSACIRSHSLILLVIAYSDFIHNNY